MAYNLAKIPQYLIFKEFLSLYGLYDFYDYF